MRKPNNPEKEKLTDDPQSYQICGVFYIQWRGFMWIRSFMSSSRLPASPSVHLVRRPRAATTPAEACGVSRAPHSFMILRFQFEKIFIFLLC